MYYRMKPPYVLRGWEGMAWVLVKRPENWTQNLTQEQFQVLTLCDGETKKLYRSARQMVGLSPAKELARWKTINTISIIKIDTFEVYFGLSLANAITAAAIVLWMRRKGCWGNFPPSRRFI